MASQILLFMLLRLLAIATGYLTNEHHPRAAVGLLERWVLLVSGVTAVIIAADMVWHMRPTGAGREHTWDSRGPDPDLRVLAWYARVASADLFIGALTAGEIRLSLERLRRREAAQADPLE